MTRQRTRDCACGCGRIFQPRKWNQNYATIACSARDRQCEIVERQANPNRPPKAPVERMHK